MSGTETRRAVHLFKTGGLKTQCASEFARGTKRLCLMAEGPNQGLDELKRLVEARQLVPVIDRTFRLDEVPTALRYFGEQQHTGKIVVAVYSGSKETVFVL